VALPSVEVPMIEAEVVRQVRELHRRGQGSKRIARELGLARNTVRRYLRGGPGAESQSRPKARRLGEEQRQKAVALLDGPAEGNAVVVHRLQQEGIEGSVRTVQRAVAPHREQRRAAELATVRYETAPGHQMQIDFGEKRIAIAGALVRVFLFVAVLSYSRRIYVRALLSQRQDDWREGLAGAFRHFGGVPQALLIDNAGPLVSGRDKDTMKARLHPGFAQFCRDWDIEVRVCQPYRARTKGKTERGVGYVKSNAIAGLDFTCFAALESHLADWMVTADERVHGTTREVPRLRFERDERHLLRPLPARPLVVRERRMQRRVAADCFVDIDTIRYSVPHRFVRRHVDVLVGEHVVRVFLGSEQIAEHARSREPYSRVIDPSHFEGLYRRTVEEVATEHAQLTDGGRSLAEYAAVIAGGAQ
jgi:transposase